MIKELQAEHNKLVINRYFKEDGEIKGFIRVDFIDGIPHLEYFYLHKPYRNLDNTRKLIKMFTGIAREWDDHALIHTRNDKLMILIEYYFKTKPYAVEYDKDNILNAWYWVSIKNK